MVELVSVPRSHELLSTKLSPPRLHSPRVRRQALLARLDAGLEQRLTLLSAPAGFGKTTLVVEWLESLSGQAHRVGWVSLDGGDNDPLRFWRYVFTAARSFAEDAGRAALEHLLTLEGPEYDAVLTTFINQAAQQPGLSLLVLEDYHSITNPQIHAAVAFLLEHLPPALRLVILARSDPPLPLARLRARNDIHELRAADLRFSEVEGGEFLANEFLTGELLAGEPDHPSHRFQLPEETLKRLVERTEGWPAGLRLVALALQNRGGAEAVDEPERFLETFTGSHLPVVEYLVGEVLASQPEEIQQFLLETSFLDRLTGPLCDAVTGRSNSAAILHQLARLNLFVEALDGSGQWLRYYALFAEAMQYAARVRLGEAHLRRLAHRAGHWYAANGMLSQAVEAAIAAQAFDEAADWIEQSLSPRLVGNEYHTLLRWVQALPESVLESRPHLCLAYAQAILFTPDRNEPVQVDRLRGPLEMAERVWEAEGNERQTGILFAFRALVAVRQGNLPQCFAFARQALARLPQPELAECITRGIEAEWYAISLGFAAWEELFAGQLHAARRSFVQSRALCQAAGNVYGVLFATLGLAEVQARLAEPQQAAELYQQVLDELEGAFISRNDRLRRQGTALLGLAELAYERNDLAAAEGAAARVMELGRELNSEDLLAQGSWMLARLERAHGEMEAARRRLDALASQVKQPLLARQAQSWLVLLSLRAGDLAAAVRWRAARSEPEGALPPRYAKPEALIQIRVQIAQGEAGAALERLEALLAEAQRQGRLRSEIELWLLIALAYAALQEPQPAQDALAQSLKLAQPGVYLRLFLDEGEPLRPLLRAAADEELGEPAGDWAQAVLAAGRVGAPAVGRGTAGVLGGRGRHRPVADLSVERRYERPEALRRAALYEPLSGQEQRVLRLLAGGLSNPEIAEELTVSVNTVKTHVKSIYRKLDINSRRAAREALRRGVQAV